MTGGSFTTNIVGGFVSATLTFAPGWRDCLYEGDHVEIFAPGDGGGGQILWEGKRRRPTYNGRDIATCELAGYAPATMDCNPFQTSSLAAAGTAELQYPANRILEFALAQTKLLQVNNFGSPAVQHTLSSFDGRTPWQVMDQLSTEAGYAFQCYDGRLCTWQARTPPATPDYLIPIDECSSWQVDDSAVFTRVQVKYTDVVTGATATTDVNNATDHNAENRIGTSRLTVIQGGKTSAAGATLYAQTYLAAHSTPLITASLTTRQLRKPNGDRVPAYGARSGQWVQIGDSLEAGDRGTVQIVQTTVDWTGQLTAQLGQLVQNNTGLMTEVLRVMAAVKTGSNPNSGSAA